MNTLPTLIDHARGDATGLSMPAHGEALRAGGAAFLTEAFRRFGALAADNAVARIVRLEPCAGGSTGQKFFLTVEYARAGAGLHTELFVKFSRDFADPRRDHGRREMETEARFAPLSRQTGFPIAIPAVYFADYEAATGTGMLITERIAFGRGAIEPQHLKCRDHELADPLPYYRAIVTALARLSAAHKAGRLAPDIDARFPFDPKAPPTDPILYDAAELDAVLAHCAEFAERAPRLLPAELRASEFRAKLEREARRVREHEAAIQAWLRGDPDLVALCHWNAHIDNAWFWRDERGELQCGLIDWGRVNQITFGEALWGCLSAAHHDIWNLHLDELLQLFVTEHRAHGGPPIPVERLKRHLLLHVAAMGVARVFAFPEIVLFRVPDAVEAAGPLDPRIQSVDPARNCLHVYTVLLELWRGADVGAALDVVLEDAPPSGELPRSG